jgi:hypothetical protein
MTWRYGIRKRLGGLPPVSCCLLILSLGAFLLGTKPPGIGEGGTLQVEQRSVSLGGLPPGVEVPVTFAATNRTGEPIKLLGVSQLCTSWGCVYWERTAFPVWVAPCSTSTFRLKLRTRKLGTPVPFNAEVSLYSDAPGSEQTSLRVSGSIVLTTEP